MKRINKSLNIPIIQFPDEPKKTASRSVGSIPQDGAKPWETYYDEPWTPPNWDWWDNPIKEVTKKDLADLDNKYKTGLRNFKTLNFDCMGRYGIWPDWNKIPQETKEQYGLTKYGTSYINTYQLLKYYIGACDSIDIRFWFDVNINNPHDKNKLYGIFVWWWYWDYDTHDQELVKDCPTFPQGSFPSMWGSRPPYMVKSDNRFAWDGRYLQIDYQGEYIWVEATVSKNSRTIKSKRV